MTLLWVIDDEETTRTALRDALEDAGYRVEAFANAADALHRFRRPPAPAVIVLDWAMPGMNGGEFLEKRAATEAWAKVPVVVVSDDGADTPPAGARAIVNKSTHDKLLSTIGGLL